MRIVIIGAGAMGCLFATRLAGVAQVALFDIDLQVVNQIAAHGVRVTERDCSQKCYQMPVFADVEQYAKKADLAIVFTKSYATTAAAQTAQALLASDGVVLTLQNGVGNVEQIDQVFGKGTAVAGITAQAANMASPGHIIYAGAGLTRLSASAENPSAVERIQLILQQAGLETEISEDADSLIWGKLIINVGINALTALLRVHNGVLAEIPECRELMKGAVDEAVQVAQAFNITLPYSDPMAAVIKVCQDTAANRASMLQDVQRQARTEIDAINGAIVRMGKDVGVTTPVNHTITQMIKALEATYTHRIHDIHDPQRGEGVE